MVISLLISVVQEEFVQQFERNETVDFRRVVAVCTQVRAQNWLNSSPLEIAENRGF